MDIERDVLRILAKYVFLGQVSSTQPASGTAIVRRPDKDNKTTAPLAVLNRGTRQTKDYWMPAVDDQVLCLLLPNTSGKGPGSGVILGAIYSGADVPPGGVGNTVRVLSHPGDLVLNIGGTFKVSAGSLDITGGGDVVASGISLTGHVHGGVLSGGSTTGGPQ